MDYILTHCAPTSITQKIIPHARADRLTDFLEEVKNRARYHYWLFGHLHDNQAEAVKESAEPSPRFPLQLSFRENS